MSYYSKEEITQLLDAQENIANLLREYRKAAKAASADLSEFQIGIVKLLLTETYGPVEVNQVINLSEVHPLSGQLQGVVFCYLPDRKVSIDIYPDHLRLDINLRLYGLQGMVHNPTQANREKLSSSLEKAIKMAIYYREEEEKHEEE